MQARKNYASYNAPFKELSAKEIVDAVGSFSNIRTIVARDLYTFRFGAGGGTKPGDYVMLTRVKASSGNLDAYEKTLESLKPVIEEAIKAGKLKSWNVWKRTLATNVAGASDYTIGFAFNTLDEALSYASGKVEISADFKKVFPKIIRYGLVSDEYKVILKQVGWQVPIDEKTPVKPVRASSGREQNSGC